MKVINLFGQPSAGKSTTAAGLFYLMKLDGINCELVTEYAKDMVWEERDNILNDQLYVTAKQNRRLLRLKGKVDWVVTDSPLLLGMIYAPTRYYPHYIPLVMDVFDSYDNVNFLITAKKQYNPVGRKQTKEEAAKVAGIIKHHLDSVWHLEYETFQGDEKTPHRIFNSVFDVKNRILNAAVV